MGSLLRLIILLMFVAIIASLGSALYQLSRGPGGEHSAKMARALTVRIGLSIVLFLLLMLAWYAGLISPHGLTPGR